MTLLLAGLLTADVVELAEATLFFKGPAKYYVFMCNLDDQVKHVLNACVFCMLCHSLDSCCNDIWSEVSGLMCVDLVCFVRMTCQRDLPGW